VLELAGCVAGVFADFEHGDDDYFDRDLLGVQGQCCEEREGEK